MKKILFSLLRQLAFWVLFFDFTRLVFILFHIRLVIAEKIPLWDILGIFWHSINLDVATACYILIIPFVLLVIQSMYSPRWLNQINKGYSIALIFGYSITAIGEMGIYAEWKTKLTYKVIKYLSNPSEIYNSAETSIFFILLILWILIFTIGVLSYLKVFYLEVTKVKWNWWFSTAFFFITPFFLFLGLRGGIQEIPINQSQSYFSKFNILNQASVNNGFNLYISIFENLSNIKRDPYVFMGEKEAEAIVKKIYETTSDTTISILKSNRPNIVMLILESWSADLIEHLGGEKGITPEFQKLEQNGILFDNIYSSGSRSEQGMASIFGGFPATPISSITVQPDKYVKLPSLTKKLAKSGYKTSFYFGGQLIYGNIKSYIMFNGFDRIMEGRDFPANMPQGKLGIHDEYTLGRQLADMNKERQPFFSALFTLSTHSPWDQPYEKPIKWGENEREYLNAALYTDHCLGEFFAKAKNQKWFNNTLFIIVADHSHNSYRNWHPQSKEYHKIPLLFYGNVIRDEFKGTIYNKTGNQQDIAATLLAQLGLSAKDFHWSKNLLNPTVSDFAYFANEDGCGWIRPTGWFSYDAGPNYYHFLELEEKEKDSLVREGKAYLQVVFKEYLEK
jgi:phosphoglycerol transferase MdoB-like AlkP superfamily enzyme